MKFKTEAELCQTFIDATPDDWTSYPETGGFDILLVHSSGAQIGIEAKLTLNAKVIQQSAEGVEYYSTGREGPDFRAVLVPSDVNSSFVSICKYVGISVIYCVHPDKLKDHNRYRHKKERYFPELPPEPGDFLWQMRWFDFAPVKRIDLPDYVPRVPAGVAAPMKLSAWKIAAMRICVLMDKSGFLCRQDFTALKINISRWMPSATGWLALTEKRGVYQKGRNWPGGQFKAQHLETWDEIVADFDVWCPKGRVEPDMPTLFGGVNDN